MSHWRQIGLWYVICYIGIKYSLSNVLHSFTKCFTMYIFHYSLFLFLFFFLINPISLDTAKSLRNQWTSNSDGTLVQLVKMSMSEKKKMPQDNNVANVGTQQWTCQNDPLEGSFLFECGKVFLFFFQIRAAVTSFSTLYFSYVSHPRNFIGQPTRVIRRVKWRGAELGWRHDEPVTKPKSKLPTAPNILQHAGCMVSKSLNVNSLVLVEQKVLQ